MTLAFVQSPDAASAPVVALLLHGYGSDERDLAALSGYLPEGLEWASVRAPLRGPGPGFSWYALDSAESWAREDAIGAATDGLWAWIDEALAPGALVLPVGFSQGGLIASQLLRTRPERVLGAAILSGYVLPTPLATDDKLAVNRVPVFWGRGELDQVIPPHAIAATAHWLPGHSALEERVYPGMGHSVNEAELSHLQRFLAATVDAT